MLKTSCYTSPKSCLNEYMDFTKPMKKQKHVSKNKSKEKKQKCNISIKGSSVSERKQTTNICYVIKTI